MVGMFNTLKIYITDGYLLTRKTRWGNEGISKFYCIYWG